MLDRPHFFRGLNSVLFAMAAGLFCWGKVRNIKIYVLLTVLSGAIIASVYVQIYRIFVECLPHYRSFLSAFIFV
jgi:hypothetical protein